MLCDIVFAREERPHAAKLEDALAAVENGEFIHRHEAFPGLLVADAPAALRPAGVAFVEQIDGFFPEHLGKVFQGGLFLASEEDGAVAVSDDGVHIVLVNCLELALRLENDVGGDFPAAHGGDQLLKFRNLPDVRKLVEQAPDVNGKPSAVYVVGFIAEQVKKLGVHHGD